MTTTRGAVTTKDITFQATGVSLGSWVNYAEMTSPAFRGTNVARFAGEVVAP